MVYREKGTIWQYILCFFLFIIPFWGITEFSDKQGYISFLKEDIARDPVFLYISYFVDKFFPTEDLFLTVYKLHIILIALSYIFLFKKFKTSPLLPTITLILFFYVPIGNQIRFYLAFPLIILSLYYFFEKKKIYGCIFLIIAISSHFSVLIFFVSSILFEVIKKTNFNLKHFIFYSNFILFFLLALKSYLPIRYLDYFNESNQSSFFGGLYNVIFYLIIYSFIFKIYTQYLNEHESNRSIIVFLLIISICSTIFLLPGIFTQIFINRFVSPLLPIWIIFFRKCILKFPKSKIRINRFINLTILIYLLKIYLLPYIIFGKNTYIDEIIIMVESYSL